MPKFVVGDRVRVQEAKGVPVEWLGAKGTIERASDKVASGGRKEQPFEWDPVYTVRMDGVEKRELIQESWLESE